eukprot:gnl/Dysnectes_brevis/3747_a4811_1114.p1 GENE.gnl/Dysnectes_brevis/3747_a4811_1114~~gnl/Dysnectes_brevis/3747_a4811_1114.p1  ORF type:complete len:185 (-),score=11.51 gnl/Dysnectes_brevis/3747_a4811_1114:53-607(-)
MDDSLADLPEGIQKQLYRFLTTPLQSRDTLQKTTENLKEQVRELKYEASRLTTVKQQLSKLPERARVTLPASGSMKDSHRLPSDGSPDPLTPEQWQQTLKQLSLCCEPTSVFNVVDRLEGVLTTAQLLQGMRVITWASLQRELWDVAASRVPDPEYLEACEGQVRGLYPEAFAKVEAHEELELS